MTEMLDVYDANRRYIGTADRDVVHNAGLWHKTVHCWVSISSAPGKNWMVFQRRSRDLESNAGKLYTTASGHVLAGEKLSDAYAREIKQEIGLDITAAMDCRGTRLLFETVWVADIKKKDGSIFVDRVFCNVFCAQFENKSRILIDDMDFWRQFHFDDGEVESVVAVMANDFIDLCDDCSGNVKGLEWNGTALSEIILEPGDFVVNEGETMYGKYKRIADLINLGGLTN
ncbi:MAG: NUDIX domain-containing protein [Alphaproteobacteria bacterium]|nr:NUDIX domain-containing protein [Alphaproteobacteria bacterium]